MDLAALLPDATICAIDKHVPSVEDQPRDVRLLEAFAS
jgi:hypothetical protein